MLNRLQEFFLPNIDNRNADARTPAGEAVASPAPLELAQPAQAAQHAQPAPPVQPAPQGAPAAARAVQPMAHRAEAGLRAQAAAGQAVVPARQLPAGGGNQGAPRPVAPVPQPAAAVRSPRARHAQGQPAAAPRLGLPAGPQGVLAHQAAAPRPAAAPRAAVPGLMAAPLWAAGARGVQPAARVAAQPAVQPPVQPAAQAAGQVQQPPILGPYPVRQPDRDIIVRQAADAVLKLRDLRIADEHDHELVFAPPIAAGTFNPIVPAVDAESAALEGREYLQYLATDPRTCFGVRRMIKEMIIENTDLSLEKIDNIVARLRPVMAELYRNEELSGELNILGLENLEFCHDRVELSIGQMEDAALLSHLSVGRIDEITLYNYGVSFFMLNEVREKAKQIINEALDGAEPRQGSHDILNAVFYLQDELHLPTRQERPIIPNVAQGIVDERVAVNVIGPYVKNRAIEKNGELVRKFMGTWKPWVDHLNRHDPLAQKMTQSFQNSLLDFEEFHAARAARNIGGGEQEYINHMNSVSASHNATKAELAGRLAEELLFNWRAEYLALQGRLPPYFG